MRGKMTIIETSGHETIADIEREPHLSVLQAAVAGSIEAVPYFDTFRGSPCIAYINEDGKSKNLPVNRKATEHWYVAARETVITRINDMIVGNIVILTGDDEFMLSMRN